MIKVSVIIPFYNGGGFLKECLENVTNQSLSELEILCIDDGSTDDSEDIVKCCMKKDNRIRLFSPGKVGVAVARNIGMDNAIGEKIVFMDCDDLYPFNDTLEVMYKKSLENGVLICGGSVRLMKDGQVCESVDSRYLFERDGIVFYKDYQYSFGYWRFMYDRHFLNDRKLRFPDYKRYQDPPFFVRAMIQAGKFYALKCETYVYRRTSGVRIFSYEKTKDIIDGISDVLALAKENKFEYLFEETIHNAETILRNTFLYNVYCNHWDLIKRVEKKIAVYLEDGRQLKLLKIVKRCENWKEIAEKFLEKISSDEKLFLYGAGKIGRLVGEWIDNCVPGYEYQYVVSEKGNEELFNGKKIYALKELPIKNIYVVVSVGKKIQGEIEERLKQKGISNYYLINEDDMIAFNIYLWMIDAEKYVV